MRLRIRYLLAFVSVACGSPLPPQQPPALAAASTSSRQSAPAQLPSSTAASVSPKADLSKQLGGMRLAMTVEEFRTACRSAQGEVTRVSEIDLTCSVAPEPLRSTSSRASLGGTVAGKFCGPGATICELAYVLDGEALRGDDQTGALVELLVGKYGPPSSADGYAGNDPMARCRRDRSAHFKRSWIFDPQQSPPHPAGSARLAFACDLRVSAEAHSLTLLYDDEHGIRYRSASEQPPQRDNF